MSLILSGTDGLSDIDGTAATPAIRGTDANTGIFFPAADTIAFSEGGVESMRIDSSGNVGIGTASPVANANQKSVTINGTNFSRVDFQVGGSSTAYIYSGTSNTNLGTSGSTFIAFDTNAAERMRIDSSGNVGIGKTTITAKLDVQRTSGTTEPIGRFEAAVGSYTGTSLIAANTLGASSAYNLFSCISDSDGDAGGPFTEFSVRGDGLVFMDSGYGSAAAAYGCRAWVNFVGSSGSISASGNVSSVTRNAAGDYTINFTTAMPDANYAVTAWARSSTAGNITVVTANSGTGANSTSSAKITVRDTGPSLTDPSVACVAIFR